MEGFKANPKMKSDIACYKEGGSVYKSRTHKEDPTEAAEDKAMVKKGIRQHEASKHKGEEKTEIKLKQGGRSKKESGSVRKYKSGGAIEMKKGKDDKKSIAQIKKEKPSKASAPSAATGKKKESPRTANKAARPTMTASMVGALPEAPEAASAAMDMPMDQPIEMMADGGMAPYQSNQGSMSDAELQALMAGAKAALAPHPRWANRRMPKPGNAGLGPIGQKALATDPTAAPMGAQQAAGGIQPMSAPMTPTQDIMRGVQAIGQYCGGGKAY